MDVRLAPLALGLWLSAAVTIAIGTRAPLPWLVVWVSVLVLGVASCARLLPRDSGQVRQSLKFVALGSVVGSVLAFVRILPITTGPVHDAALDRRSVRLQGTVISDPVRTERHNNLNWTVTDVAHVTVRTEHVVIGGQALRARVPIMLFASRSQSVESLMRLVPGMHIDVVGALSPAFTGSAQAASMNVRGSITIRDDPPRYQGWAWQLRQGLKKALVGTSRQAHGLVPGLALGDSSDLDTGIHDDMQAAGLTHLIAVSGSNVTLLLVVVLFLIRKFSQRRIVIYGGALLALIAFVIIVRPQPSVIRAAVMGVVALIAGFTKQRQAAVPALAVTIVILIAIDPWLAVSYGFALSVVATGALLFWAKRVFYFLDQRLSQRIPQWLLEVLAITVCAQVGVFPIMVALGSTISLASIPANMIAVPLATPAMLLGILAALLAVFWSSAAHGVAILAAAPAQAIATVAHVAASVTWLRIAWPHGLIGVGLALGVMVLGMHAKLQWSQLDAMAQGSMASIVVCLIVLIVHPPQSPERSWLKQEWLMVQCNVGQGDGAVIRTGNHQAIVVDVGPDDVAMNRCLTDLGITTIPLLVLTHFHADHVGGLQSVLHNRHIGQVMVSPLFDPPAMAQFVRSTLGAAHITPHVLTAGAQIQIGEVHLECLWPSRLLLGQGSDPNNASVVLLVTAKQASILLTGDVEPPAQDAIRAAYPNLQIDVLKIAHHGSRNQSEAFATRLHSKIAFISVGLNNDYGHPARETISLYELAGAHIWRTDQQGSLALVRNGNHLGVVAER